MATIDGTSGNDPIVTGGDDTPGGGGTGHYQVEFRSGHDRITDFDTGNEVIEVRSANITSFADIQARMTDIGTDTLITLDDGSTLTVVNTDPGDFTAANFAIGSPVGYCRGTLILTPAGPVPVQDLRVGDRLVTAGNGPRPIRWIGVTHHAFGPGPHKHKPIEIKAGALGGGLPRRTLVVSPQHRILFRGPVVEDLFGEAAVLALAKGLVGLEHVRAMNGRQRAAYHTLLCDRHQVICAEGAWSESFQPGPAALRMLDARQRREVLAILSAPTGAAASGQGPAARRTLTFRETQTLVRAIRQQENDLRKWDEDLAAEGLAAAVGPVRMGQVA